MRDATQEPIVGTPPGALRPGDHVRLRGKPEIFIVVEQIDTALIRLRSRHGVECKAGWRVVERVEADTRSANDPAAARSGGTVYCETQHTGPQSRER